ncbi:MAG: hypothetical protein OXC25_13145 [Thiotrichales bacterium]|nr:hypothetical protein [Thiotrichales bacterium]
MNINPDWITLAGIAAILGFLWSLHRDMRSLSDRVSRLAGTVELLAKVLLDREVRSPIARG